MKDEVPLRVASQLKVVALVSPTGHCWKNRQVRNLFIPSSARKILGMDVLHWPHTKSCQSSTKSTYALII